MMKDYFIIFPHAGAIRSGYQNIEGCVSDSYEVIYVDYGSNYQSEREGDFHEFVETIWKYLGKKIARKNAALILFGHSMGSCVLQALELMLSEYYFVDIIIHSDGDVLSSVRNSNLRSMSAVEKSRLLDTEYDIPDEVRGNKELKGYFEKILLSDLMLLDTIPEYVTKFSQPKGASDIRYAVFISEALDFGVHKQEWQETYPFLEDDIFCAIEGNHYSILDDFSVAYKKIN